jgi:hypothetical protein
MTTPRDIAFALRNLANQLDALEPPAPIEPRPPVPGETVLAWDGRLTARGVKPQAAATTHNLIQARYLDVNESAGKHHIFVDILDRTGKRRVGARAMVTWADGSAPVIIEEKPGEPYGGNYAMYAAGNAYALEFGGWRISGMGLGTIEEPNMGHHVSYAFVFKER